ncbi:TetR/AcrR family transcriptional regulator [Streptomyces nitrosporeus]|uniref:TetR family transcriptional regulator n=1 Tax=Streptomyces nitrosporeus TaxID=28894 RepID=A0A5J6FIR0_9ACTN|nr:TetR family transcriptional regulator [Streptomyces nitrosporeus]QEU74810.1 TetR family transcriptional regulator [Streptomyces nitrosporeus]GGY85939.1 TetR family transcriptional regulator [Streptomyces nitrosporeus]
MSGVRRVPNDPQRRERILDAALDVIAGHGVHKVTHRRVAEHAGVPLGSLTYYFDGLEDIFEQAFTRLSESMSQSYRAALESARDQDEACEVVADLICGQEYISRRELSLIIEMYSYAQYNRAVAAVARRWLFRSKDSLSLHFPEPACRALDAFIEGWPMHRAFEGTSLDRETVLATVRAIARNVR